MLHCFLENGQKEGYVDRCKTSVCDAHVHSQDTSLETDRAQNREDLLLVR